jgi:hypothetical protein
MTQCKYVDTAVNAPLDIDKLRDDKVSAETGVTVHPLETPDFRWRTDQIVEILTTSHLHVLPFSVLPPQTPKSQVALHKPIERHLARPPR